MTNQHLPLLALAFLYILLGLGTAFIIGKAAGIHCSIDPNVTSSRRILEAANSLQTQQNANIEGKARFPSPKMATNKKVPKTRYTSVIFIDEQRMSRSSYHVTRHLERTTISSEEVEVCTHADDGHIKCSIDAFTKEEYEEAARYASV